MVRKKKIQIMLKICFGISLQNYQNRYNLSHIDPNARIREYKGPINWLDEAMIINISENINDPSAAFNL